jgi:ADP-ribosyl-[dinitrogen reductase] hydrolase
MILARARGALVGQAVGDALGTTVEFSSPEEILRRSARDGWPDAIVGQGPFRVLPGQVTDDTELALARARTLVRAQRYDDDEVAAAYVRWRRSEPFDCGMATHRAFGATDLPSRDLAAFVRGRADPKTQANGSLMRISPLGLFGHRLPPSDLAALAARDSTLSHPHAACQAAVGVFTCTLARACTSELDGQALFDFALGLAQSNAALTLVVPWLEHAAQAAPPFDDEKQGWVRFAFEHAFFQLAHASDFEHALRSVVRAGGDTDTNAAITGALVGARFGLDAIPSQWVDTVVACVPARPPEYHCNDVISLADALVAVGPSPR